MYKNLKKVISAVAALALSASSFVALAATDFPDVAETATYAQAVDELTSLNIVNGYEDGTFKPENLVTRAEITKMIVSALGSSNLASAEAAAGLNTDFSDVTATHWAAGYVTEGTSFGFINGMGDGTFAPEANVTYAQAVKMLVCALGYQTWAENVGGYPQGYMSYGNQLDITTGVSGVNYDTQLNRAQVAVLIDNALNAPLLVRDGYTNDAWGRPQPVLTQMDGTGKYWQSLLTKNHDTYKVFGRVTATQKTSGGSVKPDEVTFRVEKADNFDDAYVQRDVAGDWQSNDAKFGTTAAPEYLFTYSEALVHVNDDDDWTILSITPSAKNDIVAFASDDYNSAKSDALTRASVAKMYVFTNEAQTKSTSYDISKTAEYYVNGVKYNDDNATKTLANYTTNYITGNDVGEITLIDTPQAGQTSTDGKYDYVMVTKYVDDVVEEVIASETNPRVMFENNVPLTLDLEDETKSYTFTLGFGGDEIDVTELKEDDVVSIAYDIEAAGNNFTNSSFCTVIVSRDTVTGKISSQNANDGYCIDAKYYAPVSGLVAAAGTGSSLTNGEEYTFFLDAFGKIAKATEGTTSSKSFAVVESVYQQYGDTYYVNIIDATGDKVAYELKDQATTVGSAYAILSALVADTDNVTPGVQLTAPENRVVEYTVDSAAKFKLKSTAAETPAGGANQEYRAKTNKLGDIALGEASVVVDLREYANGDYTLMGDFTDEVKYEAYGYGRRTADRTYAFVLVKAGANGINAESPMAIFSSKGSTSDEDNDDLLQVKIYAAGETSYIVAENSSIKATLNAMSEGTAFFYTTNSKGYVSQIVKAMDAPNANYNTYRASVLANGVQGADAKTTFAAEIDVTSGQKTAMSTSNKTVDFAFGPIVDKDSASITLAAFNNGDVLTTNLNTLRETEYDTDVNVMVYDYAATKAGTKVSIGAKGSALKTTFDSIAKDANDIVTWSPAAVGGVNSVVYKYTNFALVKTVDKYITDMYVILADQN